MNPFLKAGIFTLVVVALALVFVFQFDNLRAGELRKSVDQLLYENEARQVLNHYASVMGASQQELCPYVSELRQRQLDRTYALAGKIPDYESHNTFNGEYESFKTTYLLALADMYITGFDDKKSCGRKEIQLAFFYPEKSPCPDCTATNLLLKSIGAECKNVRIYAFPFDSELEPVMVLANRYSANSWALVIEDGEVLRNLPTHDVLVSKLRANGADCAW